jgi:hypothetical protein
MHHRGQLLIGCSDTLFRLLFDVGGGGGDDDDDVVGTLALVCIVLHHKCTNIYLSPVQVAL